MFWQRHSFICHMGHDDVIKWKHFPSYWPVARWIHRSPVNSPHKGQWRGDLMFSLISAWINGWVNNREAGDLRRHLAHYDVSIMVSSHLQSPRLDLFHSTEQLVQDTIKNKTSRERQHPRPAEIRKCEHWLGVAISNSDHATKCLAVKWFPHTS